MDYKRKLPDSVVHEMLQELLDAGPNGSSVIPNFNAGWHFEFYIEMFWGQLPKHGKGRSRREKELAKMVRRAKRVPPPAMN